jgi:tetratricopeptide (TPR) repeat protein
MELGRGPVSGRPRRLSVEIARFLDSMIKQAEKETRPGRQLTDKERVVWRDALTSMRRFILIVILGFGVVARAQNPQVLLQDAMQKQQSGDLQGAVREYREILKDHPDIAPIRANLGAALAGLGQYEEAIKEYKLALKLAPGTPGISLNLALAYYKMGRIDDASVIFARVHKAEPANYQATALLADCYLRMGRNKDTIRILEPLAKTQPEDLAIAYMLGTAYIRDKQMEQGGVVIDRILRNGDSAEAHLLLGMTRLEALEYPAAIADLSKAAEMNPNLPDIYSYLGQAQMSAGDMTAARAAFEKELVQNPNDFESNLRLAVLLKQDGDYTHAHQLLARALLVRPGDPGALYQVGSTYLAAGELEQARVKLEQVIKQSPQFLEAHVSLSQVYYRLKRKADGDRERVVVQRLKAEQDAEQSKTKGEVKP